MVETLMVLAFVLGLVAGFFVYDWLYHRRQRERLRQAVNGLQTDLPRWLIIAEHTRERQRQVLRKHRQVH